MMVSGLPTMGISTVIVGDGINKSPTLAVADMGMAIGVGTIVAIVAQDIVILYSLEAVITDIDLSKDIPGDFQELTDYVGLTLIHYNRSTPGTFGLLEFVRFSIWNQNWKSQLRAP
jgi:hypothetical protein